MSVSTYPYSMTLSLIQKTTPVWIVSIDKFSNNFIFILNFFSIKNIWYAEKRSTQFLLVSCFDTKIDNSTTRLDWVDQAVDEVAGKDVSTVVVSLLHLPLRIICTSAVTLSASSRITTLWAAVEVNETVVANSLYPVPDSLDRNLHQTRWWRCRTLPVAHTEHGQQSSCRYQQIQSTIDLESHLTKKTLKGFLSSFRENTIINSFGSVFSTQRKFLLIINTKRNTELRNRNSIMILLLRDINYITWI